MITIKLYGELATKFTDELVANVSTTREAIECLCINFSDFREYLLNSEDSGIVFKALIGDSWALSTVEETFYPIPEAQTIHITPVVAGSGRVGKIIAGVALLGLGIAGVGFLGLSAFQVGLLGGLLIVQGLFGGQTGAPDPEEEDQKSYIFSGPANTVAEGNPVPIIWGSLLVGSQIASGFIESYQIPG